MQNYVGKRLDGRYEIREIIGVGGMAVVYKAYDNIDDRIVSVKILKEEFLANEEFRRRFKNESKAIAVLSHTNIVKVYDVSYGDRLQYIVMEYVEGITLKEYIQQQGVINHKEAVFFVMQILRALQHAHDKGIVHRDIKPQNILLLENGAIKVTDFGIARFSASETRTMTDSTIGSVHYISPEQARGDITDDKADLYSVGVMLYEMLTGKLPFESENTLSVAIMQLQKDPVMPRVVNPQIPIGLEQIIMKAMQKNVNDRYQSAAEILLDLEEFKRNPSIQFDYTYSNNEPTKYIPIVNNKTKTKADPVYEEDEDEDDEPEIKNRTIPILVGIVVALVVCLSVGLGLAFKFGVIGNQTVKVPNFLGKIYSQDSFASDYSKLVFSVTEQINPEAAPNQILSQTPEAGEKINPKTTKINLVIATSSEMVAVPDKLVGSDYVSVVTKLTQQGLKVREKIVKAEDYPEIEAGTVIKVSPSEGTRVSVNSMITVEYVTYDENKVQLVNVPDVEGLSEDDAKKVLVSGGFTVVVQYSYNDAIKKDYVISNTFANTKIPKGSEIILTVSRGELVEQSTQIHVTLPDTGDEGVITATLDSTQIITDIRTLDGVDYTFTVSGSEPNSVFKVFIDGKLIYKCDIDFTSTPCDIKNAQSYAFEPETTTETTTEDVTLTMPSVIGMTSLEAKTHLEALGFTNVQFAQISEDSTGEIVVSQYPSAKTKQSPDVSITLYLGD